MRPNAILQKNKTALLIIDMINDFSFPEAASLIRLAAPVAKNIMQLKHRALKKGIPTIYVNDNFKRWRSNWQDVFDHCADPQKPGSHIPTLLKPSDSDYFILKPRHSGFFNTNLPTLLEDLGTQHLIVTGIAGNICVLFTVNDAYMHDYKISVPSDCIASNSLRENNFALKQMKEIMRVNTASSKSIRF